MKNSFKFYLLIVIFTSFVFVGFGQSNFYENTVSAAVCEGDSNIIKAGCSVAVGQVVRVTPGVVTGVTLDKMGDCYNKYGPTSASGGSIIVDLNDPCNQIAMTNPYMDKSKYAYVPFDETSVFSNSRPGIGSLASVMEVSSRKATDGMLMDRSFYAAQVFKNVPYLKTSFAQTPNANSFSQVTQYVFDIWELSRNLAYLLLLVGSLVLGLVIMLGTQSLDKDGKIKLSIERAIPRVVISVILISSSYWIGELIFNTLLGGGIVQGLAAFFVSLVIQGDVNSSNPGFLLSVPMVILYMGAIQGLLTATAGSIIIPVIVATVFTVWRFLFVNFLIVKNIISILIYIIISPVILVRGVLPTKDSEEAFKEYFANLFYFVIVGFLLNLILYGSKTALILGSQIIGGEASGTPDLIGDVAQSAFGGSNLIANGFIFLFSIIISVTILGYAKNVESNAAKWSKQYVGVKAGKS